MDRSTIAGLVLFGAGALFILTRRAEGEVTNSNSITPDPRTWPSGDRVWDICRAIALAEGYNTGPGAAPFDLNNPGDLSPGDEWGMQTAGPAEFHGGSRVIHFATAADGWNALHRKISNIAAGTSGVYSADWSWSQIGRTYAGDSVNWSRNVSSALGVSIDSTLAEYVGGV